MSDHPATFTAADKQDARDLFASLNLTWDDGSVAITRDGFLLLLYPWTHCPDLPTEWRGRPVTVERIDYAEAL